MNKSRTLRRQLIRIYALLIVFILTFVVIWAGLVLQNSRVEHRRQELQVEASFIAGVLGGQLADDPTEEPTLSRVQNMVASLEDRVQRRLIVVDARGAVLADSQGELSPLAHVSDADIAALLRAEGIYQASPIVQGEREQGMVYLAMPASEVRTRTYRQWVLLIGPSLAIALVMGGVSHWLAHRLLEPVRELTHTAREMAAGALDRRIDVSTADELGDMGRAFNHMADRVTGMLAEQRAFVANASHELRTPLTSIQLWIEALLGGAKDDPATATRFLNEAAQQVERLAHMVEQLLNLSRLESGLAPAERVLTSVPELVRGAAAELEPLFVQKSQAVRLELNESLPRVSLDPDQIRRALINLLDNASKYTPPGGEIRITVDRRVGDGQDAEGAWVWIAVSDSGPGIAEQDLQHIFERFYRGERARSGGERGAGLGLAIVRCIVESQHGGRVWAESQEGQGTTVTLALPLDPTAARDRAAVAPPPPATFR